MDYVISYKENLTTARWAGGTTTQLAIHPKSATYQEFNFDFRISYATVEVEESTFTFMPGVTRHLMILKGTLEIDHLERYKKTLNQFDVDVFNGEWPTKAKGKVTDFNLMTRGKASGKLEMIRVNQGSTSIDLSDSDVTAIYLLKGSISIASDPNNMQLNEGDFILFQNSTYRIETSSLVSAELIISKINL